MQIANFNQLGNIEYALITLKFHLQHIYGKYVSASEGRGVSCRQFGTPFSSVGLVVAWLGTAILAVLFSCLSSRD